MWIQLTIHSGTGWSRPLVAALPVLVLLGLLASGRVSAWRAALAGLATAVRSRGSSSGCRPG